MTLHHFLVLLFVFTESVVYTIAEGRDRCFRQVSDVVIAIDSSFSLHSHDFDQQLTFLKSLIDSFTIGRNHMQIGIVSFGSVVRLEIPLDKFRSKTALKKAVGRIRHMNSGTYTDEAIRFVHSNMFLKENGGRPWAKKKMVLITDGFASDQRKTLLEASKARLSGVEIFCIGVGRGFNDVELRGMASEPKKDHVFYAKTYDNLSQIKAALSDAACEAPLKDDPNVLPATKQALTDCKHNRADVFFLVDSSNSIWGPDFRKYITLIRQVTSSFHLGQDAIRVGIVVYTDAPREILSLSSTQTKRYLNRVLDDTFRIYGSSNTARAIQHVRNYGFTEYNKRPKTARIMVVLTDGESDNRTATAAEARAAHREGMRIFAVGVTDQTDSQELMAMASDPDDRFVFHVDNFARLSTIEDTLAVKTCDVVNGEMVKDEPAKPTPSCPSQATDVFFVYETNSLSRHHHNLVVNSISQVVESHTLVSKNLRFGVIREAPKSHSQLHDIKLTENWRQKDFKTKLDPGSKKSSAEMLLTKAHMAFAKDSTHKRTIFLFLDSSLKNEFGTSLVSSSLKRSGVRIIVVGLGRGFNSNQALYIASHPVKQNLIIHKQEPGEDKGKKLVTELMSKLCE